LGLYLQLVHKLKSDTDPKQDRDFIFKGKHVQNMFILNKLHLGVLVSILTSNVVEHRKDRLA